MLLLPSPSFAFLLQADIPSAVMRMFQKRYAGADAYEWNQQQDVFFAFFDYEKQTMFALIDGKTGIKEDGTLVEEEEYPEGVVRCFEKALPNTTLFSVYRVSGQEQAYLMLGEDENKRYLLRYMGDCVQLYSYTFPLEGQTQQEEEGATERQDSTPED